MPVVTPLRLAGLYKEAYADGIEKLYPEIAYLYKQIKFTDAERTGNFYHAPVQLTKESGITYAAPNAGAYPLTASIGMTMQDAQLQGCQTTLRTQIGMDTVARSVASSAAFKKATVPIFEANLESHVKRLELGILYGQSPSGLGQTTGSVNVDATNTTVTLSAASWAIGVWAGEERSRVIFYRSDTLALVSDGTANSVFQIVSMDPDNRQIVVSGTAAGIAALDVAAAAAPLNIYWYGVTGLTVAEGGPGIATPWAAASCVDMAGIDRILLNAGLLFNINAANFTLWRGNVFPVGGAALTMARVQAAVNRAVGKGGLKEKVACLVSVETWPNLHNDLAALRSFDSSYSSSKATAGSESLSYHGANGEIEVVGHSCVKPGEAFILPLKRFARVGSTDVTFDIPGRSEEMFSLMPAANGYEVRSFADQALLCRTPAKCVKVTGITNV
jgi:hypothetical protein